MCKLIKTDLNINKLNHVNWCGNDTSPSIKLINRYKNLFATKYSKGKKK